MPALTLLLLASSLLFAGDFSAAAGVLTPGCGGDDVCRAAVQDGSDVESTALSALQRGRALQRVRPALNQTPAGVEEGAGELEPIDQNDLPVFQDLSDEYAGIRRLSFAHVPCNFGHTVENHGLGQPQQLGRPYFLGLSLLAPGYVAKLWVMNNLVRQPSAELWGMMHPAARPISEVTGCNLYYTPGKYWPAKAAAEYFGDREIFAVVRDPYDKMANEFRMQVQGIDSGFTVLTRPEVSWREGHLERENATYQMWYATCDVNAYLQEELRRFLEGDRFRVNCHMLPQSEFVEQPYGATVFVDNRKIPDSLNELFTARGYPMRVGEPIHNYLCNNISAYSLTEETKSLIRQVYKADFELLCEKFGYCNDRELFCMQNLSRMCGGKPKT